MRDGLEKEQPVCCNKPQALVASAMCCDSPPPRPKAESGPRGRPEKSQLAGRGREPASLPSNPRTVRLNCRTEGPEEGGERVVDLSESASPLARPVWAVGAGCGRGGRAPWLQSVRAHGLWGLESVL